MQDDGGECLMPKNSIMYLGVLVVAASALLWLGAQVAKVIEWALPWAGGIGVILIIAGVFMELRKRAQSELTGSSTNVTSDKAATYQQASGTETTKTE
jgi:hypothetical protein